MYLKSITEEKSGNFSYKDKDCERHSESFPEEGYRREVRRSYRPPLSTPWSEPSPRLTANLNHTFSSDKIPLLAVTLPMADTLPSECPCTGHRHYSHTNLDDKVTLTNGMILTLSLTLSFLESFIKFL